MKKAPRRSLPQGLKKKNELGPSLKLTTYTITLSNWEFKSFLLPFTPFYFLLLPFTFFLLPCQAEFLLLVLLLQRLPNLSMNGLHPECDQSVHQGHFP